MTDKTTKLLLALIAAGLWANIIAPSARAQIDPFLGKDTAESLANDMNRLVNGTCANKVLCAR